MFLKVTPEFLNFSKIDKSKNNEKKNLHISLSRNNFCYEVEE